MTSAVAGSLSFSSQAQLVAIGTGAQLFVDDHLINSQRGVQRTLHPARKLAQPVIVPDQPWEGERVYIYGTVHYDAPSRQFRMWYLSRLGPGRQQRAPGLRIPAGDLVLYATSKDGLRWEKPKLGRHEFDGSRANNIVFDLHSPSVIVDEQERDAAQRYKMVGYRGKSERDYLTAYQGGYHAAHSADGLTWKDYPRNPILEFGDTITATRHPASGEYLAFHKRPAKIRGHNRRVVWLATSRDLQEWSTPELILAPDEQDDAWIKTPEQRTEFYDLSGFAYGDQFLGLLAVFHVTNVNKLDRATSAANQSPIDGPIHTQLVHSRDGRKWERFEDRTPIIPRGMPGSFDAGCILGVANPPVVYRDEVWAYYTAINTTHGGPMPPKRITIGRAAWRLDGFVSLDADAAGGVVETVPLKASGGKLEVNADASGGSLTVEALTADGKPLPGYTARECNVINSDNVRHLVSWQGKQGLLTDQPICLRFHLKNARLYSFRARA